METLLQSSPVGFRRPVEVDDWHRVIRVVGVVESLAPALAGAECFARHSKSRTERKEDSDRSDRRTLSRAGLSLWVLGEGSLTLPTLL